MNKWIEFLKDNDFLGVKKYIKNGADISDVNENGESVLACAIGYGCDIDLLMLLIDNGADIYEFDDEGVSIFDIAITYNNIKIVEFILKQGIDVNHTNRRSGFTPLMAAASYGRVEITTILLENAADKNRSDSRGLNAIDFARKMNKKSILEILDYDDSSPKNKSYTK